MVSGVTYYIVPGGRCKFTVQTAHVSATARTQHVHRNHRSMERIMESIKAGTQFRNVAAYVA